MLNGIDAELLNREQVREILICDYGLKLNWSTKETLIRAFMEIITLNGDSKLYNLEDLNEEQFIEIVKTNTHNYFNGYSIDPLRKQPELFPIKKDLWKF